MTGLASSRRHISATSASAVVESGEEKAIRSSFPERTSVTVA